MADSSIAGSAAAAAQGVSTASTGPAAAAPALVAGMPLLTDGEGQQYVDLGNNRRAVIVRRRGTVAIDIREYYLDAASNSMKPGKKGVYMNLEQFSKLIENVPLIDAELARL
eukprot:a513809_45.p2 GENE.a513809_45~~a513809_45.p2  ORF type:complete len:122 (-),score=48.33 a513809_45:95-430(-)